MYVQRLTEDRSERPTHFDREKRYLHVEKETSRRNKSMLVLRQRLTIYFTHLPYNRMRILNALLLGCCFVSRTAAKPTTSHGVGLFGVPRGGGLFGGKSDEKAT